MKLSYQAAIRLPGQDDTQNIEDNVRTQRIQIDLDVLARNGRYNQRIG